MKYVEASKDVFLNTGIRFPRRIIWAAGLVKAAAAKSNEALGLLEPEVARAVRKAAERVMAGEHDDLVVVDVFQTGSGTGLNMNVNEIIAEEASKAIGRKVHPNDHVNLGQSSNDVGPTVIRLASVTLAIDELLPALEQTTKSLRRLARKTSGIYKSGRTHLRDALPVTMGQEFGAFADAFDNDRRMTQGAISQSKELPIGGTAVGTGLNTHPRFAGIVAAEIRRKTGVGFVHSKRPFRAIRLLTDLTALSGALAVTAIDLYRLCQDLRLMFSGPMTGLAEIDIPTQKEVAGSSIMPGKTNPVTVESAMLACAQVLGLDHANRVASMYGEFEMALGVPLIGFNLVREITLLSEALKKTATVVIDHVVPDKSRNRKYAERSPALITVISPLIGYDRAAKIEKKLEKGMTIREALKELGYGDKEIAKILDLKKLVRPGILTKER